MLKDFDGCLPSLIFGQFSGVHPLQSLLCIDELGYLPSDKFGADCLFQILSHRYERSATVITTNHVYKHWASIGDSVLTSALLDRLLHHAETVPIEGRSYRTKDQIED